MALSPYTGNNTIQKINEYLVAYKKTSDTYSTPVAGLISNDSGESWSSLDIFFPDSDPLDSLISIGHDANKILLARASSYSSSSGELQTISTGGITSTENTSFNLSQNIISDIFEFNGKQRLFSGTTLLEFDNINYQLNTVDSPYTGILRPSTSAYNVVVVIPTGDRLVRIDRDYGVYHMLYTDLTTWIKDADSTSIDYLSTADAIVYGTYLNGEIHIHSYVDNNGSFKVSKTINGFTATSQTSVASEAVAPLMFDSALDGGVYIHASITSNGFWVFNKKFLTSPDGITLTSKGALNGVTGSSFGNFKKIINDYFFTTGSNSNTRTLYKTTNLINAAVSFSHPSGVVDFNHNGTAYLLALGDDTLRVSNDAVVWTIPANPPNLTNVNVLGVFLDGSSFVILGGPQSFGFGGAVSADTIFVSTDNGENWVTKLIPNVDTNTGNFLSSTTEYMRATNKIIMMQAFNSGSLGEFFVGSNDLGDTWNYTQQELDSGFRIDRDSSSIRSFFGGSVLFQSSINSIDISNVNTLNLSYDGGVSWNNVPHNIILPSIVTSASTFYSEIYYDGTKHILMICDYDMASINFYSSIDPMLASWTPIAENLTFLQSYTLNGVQFLNKPKIFLLGETVLFAVGADYFSLSTALFSSTVGLSVWSPKCLVSDDTISWNLVDSVIVQPSYMVGIDIDNSASGNFNLVDVTYVPELNRAVAIVSNDFSGNFQ